jgi:HipA-like protein
MHHLKTIGVNVFLEKRKVRMHAGVLTREKEKFVFRYNEPYFKAKYVIPLGPEFPLTQRVFVSEKLFPSFEDRIPSRQNPAYPDYCRVMEIDPQEKDELVLLSTIGRRGPSSFIFYPIYERKLAASDIIAFRKSLDLTTREFASVFELSQASLNAFERGRSSGKEISKRLEIILHFPAVALDFLLFNGGFLMYEKWENATNFLRLKTGQ